MPMIILPPLPKCLNYMDTHVQLLETRTNDESHFVSSGCILVFQAQYSGLSALIKTPKPLTEVNAQPFLLPKAVRAKVLYTLSFYLNVNWLENDHSLEYIF